VLFAQKASHGILRLSIRHPFGWPIVERSFEFLVGRSCGGACDGSFNRKRRIRSVERQKLYGLQGTSGVNRERSSKRLSATKTVLLAAFLFYSGEALAQSVEKEPTAIAELGGVSGETESLQGIANRIGRKYPKSVRLANWPIQT
jgi:hypothetical protein